LNDECRRRLSRIAFVEFAVNWRWGEALLLVAAKRGVGVGQVLDAGVIWERGDKDAGIGAVERMRASR